MLNPILKWAGGKQRQLKHIFPHMPEGLRLIEPFVGGGSVFTNSDKHGSFLLADVNPDLISMYQMLTVVPELVLQLARVMFDKMNSERGYFAIRSDFNEQQLSAPERAAAFLFLNRHCFNGLMRYNNSGGFNTSFGHYKAPYFPEKEIKAFAKYAHNYVFMLSDFRRTIGLAREGDVVYCDPPYEPMPGQAGFTNYTPDGFKWEDQLGVVEACRAAHRRGAKIVISNSSAPAIDQLYRDAGFTIHHIPRRQSIASNGNSREITTDILGVLD
ncbi:DNA adenine methylase [Citrobacter portucalensis]|uniref:DNA adenine methylase n=1 Tax=Citrobacter portucalensis TaxID=1639133 RepID=UPI00388D606C